MTWFKLKSVALVAAGGAVLAATSSFAQDATTSAAAQTPAAAASLSEQEIQVANLALSIDFNDPASVSDNLDQIASIISDNPSQLENLLDAALALSVDPVQLMSSYADVSASEGSFDNAAAYEAVLAVAPEQAPGLVGVMLQYRPPNTPQEDYVGGVLSTAAKFAPGQSKRIIVAAVEQLGLRESGYQGPVDVVKVAANVAQGAAQSVSFTASDIERAQASADLTNMVQGALTDLGVTQNIGSVMASVSAEAGVPLKPSVAENPTQTWTVAVGSGFSAPSGPPLALPVRQRSSGAPDNTPNVSNASNGL